MKRPTTGDAAADNALKRRASVEEGGLFGWFNGYVRCSPHLTHHSADVLR